MYRLLSAMRNKTQRRMMINYVRRGLIKISEVIEHSICARLYMYDFILKSSQEPRAVGTTIVPILKIK
jgi:hypothetical protein